AATLLAYYARGALSMQPAGISAGARTRRARLQRAVGPGAAVEAGGVAGVADRAERRDLHQQAAQFAVHVERVHLLEVARGLTLKPELSPRPAPQPEPPAGQRT